jgi:putative addiction module killer protein
LNTLLRSSDFDAWLSHLADQKAKARILARLASGHSEISAIANPSAKAFPRCGFTLERGIAFIYTRTGSTVYVLLAGGVKASQTKDIAKAKEMVCELKRTKQ